MVLSRFDMLQGAAGDVKELEYIGCLHQTDLRGGIRPNASIQAADVRLFLQSRHGIAGPGRGTGSRGGNQGKGGFLTNAMVRSVIFSGLQADACSRTEPDDAAAAVDDDDDDDDDDADGQPQPCLDLMEIVAILLIPTLLKAALELEGHHQQTKKDDDSGGGGGGIIPAPPGMLEFVLNMILHDVVTGEQPGNNNDSPSSSVFKNNKKLSRPPPPPLLTKDLVRSILVAYGEYQLAMDDDLLQEMVHAATCAAKDDSIRHHHRGRSSRNVAAGRSSVDVQDDEEATAAAAEYNEDAAAAVLNVQTFADALTLDVRLYDVRNETRMTTNLDDVFLTHQMQGGNKKNAAPSASSFQKLQHQGNSNNNSNNNNNNLVDIDDEIDFRERLTKSHDITRVNTAPAIDVTAETYRSKGLMVCLWSTIILTYFCYWAGAIDPTMDWNCEEDYLSSYQGSWHDNGKFVGCSLGQSVIRWIAFFITMSIYGVVCVSLGSLGNSTQIKRPWWPLVGLFFVLMLTFLPTGDEAEETPPEQGASNTTDNTAALGSNNVTDDYFFYGNTTTNATEPAKSWLDVSREESSGVMLRYITAVMGTITAMFHMAHILVLIVPHAWLESIPKAGRWITTGTVYAEMKMKRAAALKLANMTQNALNVVKERHDNRVIETHYGQALKNYEKFGKLYVRAGGFRWAWRILLGRKSFSREGIWLPARFVASNIAQFVMAIYILLAGCQLTRYVSNSYSIDKAKNTMDVYIDRLFADAEGSFIHSDIVQDLMYNVTAGFSDFLSMADNSTNHSLSFILGCEDYPIIPDIDALLHTYCPPDLLDCNQTAVDAALLEPRLSYLCPLLVNSSNTTNVLNSSHVWALYMASGLDLNAMATTVQNQLNAAAEKSIDQLYPAEKYMVVVPVAIGTAVAFTVAMYLALTYLPSVTTTFLQLRCGYIPTLHDKDFAFYRHAQDTVSILTGSLFWGSLVSSVVVGFIVAFIVFIFLWQATIYFAQKLTAIIVGILCITAIRMSCLCVCRGTMYQAFYRTKPRAANYSLLALEWANLALSVGFVFMRMVKLLIVAGACIGKIDSEFLAQGVGKIGPIYLDAYPKIHRKDILAHEAHRHPYMEQLGVIYMMKLRYRHHFCNRAGSCWRLIFVYALMPWLHRYRVSAHPEQSENFARIEAEHPGLQFVSLRNLDVSPGEEENEGDRDIGGRNNDEIGRGPLTPGLSASKKASTVHFANGEDADDKIKKLEAELETLRSKLRAAGITE